MSAPRIVVSPRSIRACSTAFLHAGRNLARVRHLAMRGQHRDLPAQMLGVELESLATVAAIVEIRVDLHAMPLLFSYGTLQNDAVQLSTFERLLHGHADELIGFERTSVQIEDPEFVETSGTATH